MNVGDIAGVADCAAEFLTLDTKKGSQLQLAGDIESRGASLSARGRWDATLVIPEGLAEDFSVTGPRSRRAGP
ncbi:MAG: hypothetical protein WAK96_13635 [Desulfobaccales bacterium]